MSYIRIRAGVRVQLFSAWRIFGVLVMKLVGVRALSCRRRRQILFAIGGIGTPRGGGATILLELTRIRAGGEGREFDCQSNFSSRAFDCVVCSSKSVLVQNGVFSCGITSDGVLTPCFYPPRVANDRNDRRINKAQGWQLPYYIELSGNEESLEQNREKFRRIWEDLSAGSEQ